MEASSDPGLSKIKVPGAKKVRVMKVTKQSNGQLLCEICSGVFEDVNGAVKHMPYCEQESVTQWVGNITKKFRLAHSSHKSWCYMISTYCDKMSGFYTKFWKFWLETWKY